MENYTLQFKNTIRLQCNIIAKFGNETLQINYKHDIQINYLVILFCNSTCSDIPEYVIILHAIKCLIRKQFTNTVPLLHDLFLTDQHTVL
jgi:hypothetical protein